MEDNSILELIWALAWLVFPLCFLIISIIFKKDISLLLGRIKREKLLHKKKIGESQRTKDTKYTKDNKHSKNDINIEEVEDLESEKTIRISDDECLFELCRNKSSNKYFILIEENENDIATMIIPNGKIKSLELKLFSEPELKDVIKFHSDNLLTNEQVERLAKYITVEDESYIDSFIIEQSEANQRTTIKVDDDEPPYIKNYRSMLKNADTFPSRMLRCIDSEGSVTCVKLKNNLSNKYGYRCETSGSFSASLRVLLVDGYINIRGTGDYKIISVATLNGNFQER